jgi:hypothetical protein
MYMSYVRRAGAAVALHVVPAGAQVTINKPHHSSSSSSSTHVSYSLPPCASYAGQCSWLKLLLHRLLPPDVGMVLYLDCDLLVLSDPCRLLQMAEQLFQVSHKRPPGFCMEQIPVVPLHALCMLVRRMCGGYCAALLQQACPGYKA